MQPIEPIRSAPGHAMAWRARPSFASKAVKDTTSLPRLSRAAATVTGPTLEQKSQGHGGRGVKSIFTASEPT